MVKIHNIYSPTFVLISLLPSLQNTLLMNGPLAGLPAAGGQFNDLSSSEQDYFFVYGEVG